jgi:hypothetical protein
MAISFRVDRSFSQPIRAADDEQESFRCLFARDTAFVSDNSHPGNS